MKKSEMLELILNTMNNADLAKVDKYGESSSVEISDAQIILQMIEEAGMCPPSTGKNGYEENAWDDEDD